MDYFKILTRSANPHRAKRPQGQEVPSAAVEASSSKQNPSSLKSSASKPYSRKRKRHGIETINQDGQYGTKDLSPSQMEGKATAKFSSIDRQPRLQAQGQNEPLPRTSLEECKKFYRKHKIKTHAIHASESEPQKLQEIFPEPLISFGHLKNGYSISRRLFENIQKQRYEEPTEVQMGSLPLLLWPGAKNPSSQPSTKNPQSQVNLLAVAPTGSGKTLAYLIPTIQRLLDQHHYETKTGSREEAKPGTVRAIILAPSHELVEQIVNEGKKLAQGTGTRISGLKKGMRLHGTSQDMRGTSPQADGNEEPHHALPNEGYVKSDIIVSTPPLLLHAIQMSASALPSVNLLILDEADVLLGDLFHAQTVDIWGACTNPALQTSLWSATISSSIESFTVKHILDRRKRPSKSHGSAEQHIFRIIVGTKDSSLPNINHRLVFTASEQGKLLALRQLLTPATASVTDLPSLQPPFLVFTQTIPRAIALHSELLYDIPPEAGGSSRIAVLHSELSETARSNIMAGVRKGDIWILITTDLLSRGIDFKGMNGVVSYDIPSTSASYVHRAGRTGRQGRDGGMAITLYTKEDIPYVKNVANVIAASEKARANNGKLDRSDHQQMQDWLLDSLPDVSRKTRQKLKHSGVEHRKSSITGRDPKKARSMRISTKSGYDRKLSNRRKGAAMKSRSLHHQTEDAIHEGEEKDWEGFE